LSRILYKFALFVQNEPKLEKRPNSLKRSFHNRLRKNKALAHPKNEPKTNPSKPNFPKNPENRPNFFYGKGLRQKCQILSHQNKPNLSPEPPAKQERTQFAAVGMRPKSAFCGLLRACRASI